MNRSLGARLACASAVSRATRASVVSDAVAVVRIVSEPNALSVPAKTASPTALSTGTDSPVSADSSRLDAPSTMTPSSAIRSPGRTRSAVPGAIVATATVRSTPSTSTCASSGASSLSASTDRRVRSSASASRVVPTANRTSTQAPSARSPIPTAPIAASAMRTFMSRVRRRSAVSAARATGQPPTTIESRYSESATARGAPVSDATTAASSAATAIDVDRARGVRRQNGTSPSVARCPAGRAL